MTNPVDEARERVLQRWMSESRHGTAPRWMLDKFEQAIRAEKDEQYRGLVEAARDAQGALGYDPDFVDAGQVRDRARDALVLALRAFEDKPAEEPTCSKCDGTRRLMVFKNPLRGSTMIQVPCPSCTKTGEPS